VNRYVTATAWWAARLNDDGKRRAFRVAIQAILERDKPTAVYVQEGDPILTEALSEAGVRTSIVDSFPAECRMWFDCVVVQESRGVPFAIIS